MAEFRIEGQQPISGSVEPQGNKNEALPVLCAAIMTPGEVALENVPAIEDIFNLIRILEFLGAHVDIDKKGIALNLKISSADIEQSRLPKELSSAIRGSITLMAPLLVRTGEVFIPRPGGDKIGRRRVDTHLLALHALGAEVEV